MTTRLMCQGCARRCGDARRGDDGQGLDRDHVVVDFRYNLHERPPYPPAWRDSRTDTAALIYDLRRRLEWPATFPCEHCGVRLQLDRARAVRVGRDRRILVPLA